MEGGILVGIPIMLSASHDIIHHPLIESGGRSTAAPTGENNLGEGNFGKIDFFGEKLP